MRVHETCTWTESTDKYISNTVQLCNRSGAGATAKNRACSTSYSIACEWCKEIGAALMKESALEFVQKKCFRLPLSQLAKVC